MHRQFYSKCEVFGIKPIYAYPPAFYNAAREPVRGDLITESDNFPPFMWFLAAFVIDENLIPLPFLLAVVISLQN